jgi:predicted nucleotidyltransferase
MRASWTGQDYVSRLAADSERISAVVSKLAQRDGILAVYLTGSFAQGIPLYASANGGLRAVSDVDLFVIHQNAHPGGRIPEFAAAVSAGLGLATDVGVVTLHQLAHLPPNQPLWEVASLDRVLWRVSPDVRFPEVIARYVPTLLDARRLIVNRFADLMISKSRLEQIRCVRAAVDAALILRVKLAPLVHDRLIQARKLGREWAQALELYRLSVDIPIVDQISSQANDLNVDIALAALRLAADDLSPLWDISGRYGIRDELRIRARLAGLGWFGVGKFASIVVHRNLARALVRHLVPSKADLRAWSLLHHGT